MREHYLGRIRHWNLLMCFLIANGLIQGSTLFTSEKTFLHVCGVVSIAMAVFMVPFLMNINRTYRRWIREDEADERRFQALVREIEEEDL